MKATTRKKRNAKIAGKKPIHARVQKSAAPTYTRDTRKRLEALVETHDEQATALTGAKAKRKEIAANIASTVAEVHDTIKEQRDENGETNGTPNFTPEACKKLSGLEADRRRWLSQLEDAEAKVNEHKETLKGTITDIFQIIRDSRDGTNLFEKPTKQAAAAK